MLMSELRRRWAAARNPMATVMIDPTAYVGPGFSLHAPYGGTFSAGPGVEFRRGFLAELSGPNARISIGPESVFTYDVLLQCSHTIEIGAHCSFGQAALVADGRYQPSGPGTSDGRPSPDEVPPGVTISDHAVITAKATVIADVGEYTCVGANSVVTQPLPARCVAAGVPARVLDFFDENGDAIADAHDARRASGADAGAPGGSAPAGEASDPVRASPFAALAADPHGAPPARAVPTRIAGGQRPLRDHHPVDGHPRPATRT